jgi:hypothetical protein
MNKFYKHILITLGFSFIAFFGFSNEAMAEEHLNEWNVTYTSDQKITSSFGTEAAKVDSKPVMPGDTVVYKINLVNDYKGSADFFMEADVLNSLEYGEDGTRSGAANGAYQYSIVSTQIDKPVFDSDTVGGDSDFSGTVGLNQVSGKEGAYLSLGTVTAAQKTGCVTVTIKIDANSQDNSYEDQLAKLKFILGAEATDSVRDGGDTIVTHNNIVKKVVSVIPGATEIVIIEDDDIPLAIGGNPATGDSTLPLILSAITLLIGLGFIFVYFKLSKDDDEEVA